MKHIDSKKVVEFGSRYKKDEELLSNTMMVLEDSNAQPHEWLESLGTLRVSRWTEEALAWAEGRKFPERMSILGEDGEIDDLLCDYVSTAEELLKDNPPPERREALLKRLISLLEEVDSFFLRKEGILLVDSRLDDESSIDWMALMAVLKEYRTVLHLLLRKEAGRHLAWVAPPFWYKFPWWREAVDADILRELLT